jgi:8-oxo-dGTP diphosphatase
MSCVSAVSAPSLRGPLVGTSAIVVRDGRVLLGRRRGAHGAGTWSPAGGKPEPGESPADAAARELREETGLVARELHPVGWTSDVFPEEGLHYVTLHHAVVADGEPRLLEPDKCEGWAWFDPDALPQPLFAPVASLFGSGWRPPR